RSEPLGNIFKTASQVAEKFRKKDFLAGVDLSLRLNRPEYQVRIDRQKAMDLGLNLSDIGTVVKTMVSGNVPSFFKEGAYYYPIRVMMSEKEIRGQYDLENIYLFTPKSAAVPLNAVARVVQTVSPLQIDRKDQMRMIKVTANVQDKSVGEATDLLKSELAAFILPAGYRLNYGGQSQMLGENSRQMVWIVILALFLGYVVMVLYFESFLKPLIIIVRIPLSLAGMTFALYLTGTPLSVTAMIGVIMLSGMEINNGVLLLTFIDELSAAGETTWNAVTKAALVRFRPILITDVNSIAGLLPLAFMWGDGTELLKPMAVVVIGGLIFGMLMVFIFLPVLYMIVYGGRDNKHQVEKTEAPQLGSKI
ncbi:MAG: efflux RND transporter permease subunit, partial [Candidatus Aminicenantes bacterium]|nr:efflux RND transporter permease subunit [Candidatus Aminicenantes bacterium]